MAYRAALVGCGAIADRHLDALKYLNEAGRIETVAAADLNEKSLRAASRRYGSRLRHYADYVQMIENEKPDIAIITLPHHLHAEAACFAASAGCHVLLEKPMALNVQECDRIMEHARRVNVALLVGHTLRYTTPIRQAKEIIREGSLGQLIMVHDARHSDYFAEGRPDWFFSKDLSGGGIAFNLGAHSVDKAIWLAGSPVASVTASMTFHGDRGDVEGSVMAGLRLRNGVTAAIVQSGYKGASANYTELLFTAGSLRLDSAGTLYRSQGGAYELVELPSRDDPFVLQLEDLMSAIESGTTLACTMDEAKHVVEVLEGMYRSHRSGREETILETIGSFPSRLAQREASAFAAIPPARMSADGAWADIRDGAELAIAHYRWTPEHHGPKARAALSYTSDELQLCLRAYEKDPLTRFTGHNDPVYKDSCLEFFLQPSPDEDARYLNLELNAAGTLRIGIGAARNDRLYLPLEELPPLHIRASKDRRDPSTGETYWEVRLRLSLTWLASLFPTFRPSPGTRMRGNLYKCGDETSLPHYGSWSPVRADAPDFHRGEDFGWLVLGEQEGESPR